MSLRSTLLVACVCVLAAAPVAAEKITLAANLSGANEVPPTTSAGKGTADVSYNTDTRELSWEVRVEGLSAPVSAAHFHGPGSTAENAGVVVPIAKAGDSSPFKGATTLTPEQADGLLAGHWYVNVHTANHPPGEIRGQVVRK